MRQPNRDCVANFLSSFECHGGELMILSARSDYTNRKLHGCTALDPSKRLVDLFHGHGR